MIFIKFLVIEGDNGTGKDTLAQNICLNGFDILTYDNEIRLSENNAKKSQGEEKIEKFLEYNQLCSDYVNQKNNNVILIRYWISTLCASYADNIYSYEKVISLSNELLNKLIKPDAIIRLTCNHSNRVNRIIKRKFGLDDVTLERAKKYEYISMEILNIINVNFIQIDTTNKSIMEVYDEAIKYLKSEGIIND